MKLYNYQKAGVVRIENTGCRTLLADEMGLGKTIQTLTALERNPDWLPALVICPASLKHNWRHEAFHACGLRAAVHEGTKPPSWTGHEAYHQAPISIINYDILKPWYKRLRATGYQTLIIDECQHLQNPRAQRTRYTAKLAAEIPRILALSGTPLTNRPAELYPVLRMIWPEEFPSWTQYAMRYCDPTWTPWGWTFKGATKLAELHRRLSDLGMIRRRKSDVLKDLPDKVLRVVTCPLSDPAEYQEAERDFLGWLDRIDPAKVRSAARAEAMTRVGYLLRLTARLKLPAVVEWANRFLEESTEKLVMFGNHRPVLQYLGDHIRARSVTIHGGVPTNRRQDLVHQFQRDTSTRLFVGNLAAATGLTLTSASTLAFSELYWRPGDHMQAGDRIHRIGQRATSWIYYLVAEGTIEERLCQLLQEKQAVIGSVMDGEQAEDLSIYDIFLEGLRHAKKTTRP